MTRGSTPKDFSANIKQYRQRKNLPLESYKDIDVFDAILTAMGKIGVKVIAYMGTQGPAMLQQGEKHAFDYDNRSQFINSCKECPGLTGIAGNCKCAPSVWWWKKWVLAHFGANDVETLKVAYAQIIVREFAMRYGTRIAGYWFDQGDFCNRDFIKAIVRKFNPNAVMTFNRGKKDPLRNNSPGYEDYTYGHPTPLYNRQNRVDGCYNYGNILAAEASIEGYAYNEIRDWPSGKPAGDYAMISNPFLRPTRYTFNPQSGGGAASLAHLFMPVNTCWTNGDVVWNVRQGFIHLMKHVTT